MAASFANDLKLVYPVTFTDFDWRGYVIRQWGVEWSKKDIVYEFSNGRKFEDSGDKGGPYA